MLLLLRYVYILNNTISKNAYIYIYILYTYTVYDIL